VKQVANMSKKGHGGNIRVKQDKGESVKPRGNVDHKTCGRPYILHKQAVVIITTEQQTTTRLESL